MNITQLISESGNTINNQIVITTTKGKYFQSYGSLIAFKPKCGSTPELTEKWNYSATTIKHLKSFLCVSLSKKELEFEIKSGRLILNDSLEIK